MSTRPTAQAGGFSVHRRSQRHDSPTGLPGPLEACGLDVPGRVLIAVEHEAAVCTDRGTHTQALRYAFPTAATILRGIGGWYGDDSTPGACCLGFEDGAELRPARVTDGLGKAPIPHQVGDPQVFEIDRVVLAQQRQRGFVMEVGALALDVLMRLAELGDGFAPSLAALLAASDAAVRFDQLLLPAPIVTGILHRQPISGDEKDSQAHVNTCLVAGRRQGLRGRLGAREDGIPAVRLFADGDGLGCAFQRAAPTHRHAAYLAQHKKAVI
jgi:hypothetical protein